MANVRINPVRAALVGGVILAVSGLAFWFASGSSNHVEEEGFSQGIVEVDVRSKYSRIKVTRQKKERTLWFVRDNGEEVVESMVNMDAPHDLLINYTRYMFLSYVFRPKQEKVLIVGLGGGAMVHFLNAYDAKAKVDVVEIDPEIVRIADKYFHVRTGVNVKIFTQDGFAFLKNTESRYDVIYMDAFLKPSRDTDSTGVPLRLKTIKFYKDVQKKLTAEGLVVFNINGHDTIEDDLKNIRDAFPQTYAFVLPREGGLAVVASMAEKRLPLETIVRDAGELDLRFRTTYSFQKMATTLRR